MQEGMSTQDYFKARRAKQPGTEEFRERQEMRRKQAPFRQLIEGKVKKLVQDDMRYR